MSGLDPHWRKRAICKGLDPNLFILDRGYQPQQALEVCNGPTFGAPCPVRLECRAYRDENKETGVWGGEYFSTRDRDWSVADDLVEAVLDISKLFTLNDARPQPADEEDVA